MKRRILLIAATLGVSVPIGNASAVLGVDAGTARDGNALVIFGGDTIRAEVAATSEERQRGLMFQSSVPDGTGMLFVFPRPGIQGIWMKDTYVPLDVAFLDQAYTVLNIEPLEPEDLATKSSAGYALFALEVRQGWFADHGVEPGDRADIVYQRGASMSERVSGPLLRGSSGLRRDRGAGGEHVACTSHE